MADFMQWIVRIGEKGSSLGAVTSAMGCMMCFPAIATLGSALGLGFLVRWESLLINTLLPAFALLGLALHAIGWLAYRQWRRSMLGMLGPVLLLLSLYPWFKYGWSAGVTYAALALMIAVSIWDLVSPAHWRCADDRCGRVPT